LPLGDDHRQLLEVLPGREPTALDPVEFVPVLSQALQADGVAGLAFVGNVVGRAGETIDRLDRPAQAPRQQQRGNGKFS
jgi:hypothetical protein